HRGAVAAPRARARYPVGRSLRDSHLIKNGAHRAHRVEGSGLDGPSRDAEMLGGLRDAEALVVQGDDDGAVVGLEAGQGLLDEDLVESPADILLRVRAARVEAGAGDVRRGGR